MSQSTLDWQLSVMCGLHVCICAAEKHNTHRVQFNMHCIRAHSIDCCWYTQSLCLWAMCAILVCTCMYPAAKHIRNGTVQHALSLSPHSTDNCWYTKHLWATGIYTVHSCKTYTLCHIYIQHALYVNPLDWLQLVYKASSMGYNTHMYLSNIHREPLSEWVIDSGSHRYHHILGVLGYMYTEHACTCACL